MQGLEQFIFKRFWQTRFSGEAAKHADMAEIEMHIAQAGGVQRREHEFRDLHIALRPRMTEQFSAELQQFTRSGKCIRAGAQDATHITKTQWAFALKKMCVDTCRLRRHIGTHTHEPAGELIGKLKGL